MKKIGCFIIACSLLLLMLSSELKEPAGVAYASATSEEELINSISSKLIRFHVIANSDSVEDQNLKNQVRDAVLEYIEPKLQGCSSIEASRKIIMENDAAIRDLTEQVVSEKGYNYTVETALSRENFPVKNYGNITFPQGNYEAYRIIIGQGAGQNWWCVAFPPLCFTDITKGELSEKNTEAVMKDVFTEEEYEVISTKIEPAEIKVKFKIAEVFKKIIDSFNKI
jgi:stage II sporulation protein R